MAHADYNCCAVCDEKLAYAGFEATTKEEICDCCREKLTKKGVVVHDVYELIAWVQNEDAEKVAKILTDVGFRFCHYHNYLDEVVKKKIGDMVEICDRRISLKEI